MRDQQRVIEIKIENLIPLNSVKHATLTWVPRYLVTTLTRAPLPGTGHPSFWVPPPSNPATTLTPVPGILFYLVPGIVVQFIPSTTR